MPADADRPIQTKEAMPTDREGLSAAKEGDLTWTPSASWIADANLTAFMTWLAWERGQRFAGYADLWQWSVTDLDGFWQAIWDYFDVHASTPPQRVLGSRTMPGAQWFPGARLNYAEHALRHERRGGDALLFLNETTPLAGMPWETFAGQVRILCGIGRFVVQLGPGALILGVGPFRIAPTVSTDRPAHELVLARAKILAERG